MWKKAVVVYIAGFVVFQIANGELFPLATVSSPMDNKLTSYDATYQCVIVFSSQLVLPGAIVVLAIPEKFI
jgi:hypothetical protein